MKDPACILIGSCLFFLSCMYGGTRGDTSAPVALIQKEECKTFSRMARSPLMRLSKPKAWAKVVPEIQRIIIASTADGTSQPALFYDSGSKRKKPLLLVLHSWSADYRHHFSIPYGLWAVQNDWVFIHPDYRGAYKNPQATASEPAIRDILDALEYARNHAFVDESRIYITGFSGGGMTTLIMVGRYPELWAGASAWVPVYDLAQWYQTTKHAKHNYSRYIENSCGGPPLPGTSAEKECRKRSVSAYLKNPRSRSVPVFIATGVRDLFVPPGHSLQAFNDLADEKDCISPKDIDYINKNLKLPNSLTGTYSDNLFTDAGYKVLFEKTSAAVTLKVYDGNHDVIYNAGLYWLSRQKK